MTPPVQALLKQALHPFFLGVCYVLSFVGAGLVVASMRSYGPVDEPFYLSGQACVSVVVLVSLYIFWKKPRSRHHAAIFVIISLLVLVFGSVYYFEQIEETAHDDAQGPIRY